VVGKAFPELKTVWRHEIKPTNAEYHDIISKYPSATVSIEAKAFRKFIYLPQLRSERIRANII
jgi:hypothetical protein